MGKLQHQVKFKQRRPKKPRSDNSKTKLSVPQHASAAAPPTDPTRGQLVVSERELGFARALTDADKDVRDAALTSLRAWLAENSASLGAGELARLWKALFYCLWMADKRPAITAAVNTIVELSDVAGRPYMAALFACLAREWFGIDRHRVDKFYELTNTALVRLVSNCVGAADTDDKAFLEGVEAFLQLLDENVWIAADKGALGLVLHVLEKYNDSVMLPFLVRAKALPGNHVHKVFHALLEPVLNMLAPSRGYNDAVARRVIDRTFERLPELMASPDLKLTKKSQRDMVNRVSKRVFNIASAMTSDDDANTRKALYDARLSLKAYVSEMDDLIAAGNKPKKGKEEAASSAKEKRG